MANKETILHSNPTKIFQFPFFFGNFLLQCVNFYGNFKVKFFRKLKDFDMVCGLIIKFHIKC